LTTRAPNGIVTDKLGSYRVARRELISTLPHDTNQYANNLYEASHRGTCEKERQMKRFRTVATAQRFLVLRRLVRNFLDWGRHAMSPAPIGTSGRIRATLGRWQRAPHANPNQHISTPHLVRDKAVSWASR
jgi:hypothetical protein